MHESSCTGRVLQEKARYSKLLKHCPTSLAVPVPLSWAESDTSIPYSRNSSVPATVFASEGLHMCEETSMNHTRNVPFGGGFQ